MTLPLYAIKAKAVMLDHAYYCERECGWTGDSFDVLLLPESSRSFRRLCPDCNEYVRMRHVEAIKVRVKK